MTSKLLNLIAKIPYDKLLHLIVGYFISDFIYHLLIRCTVSNIYVLIFVPLAVVLLAGAIKEIYDKLSGKGTPEFKDWGYTTLGGVINLLIVLI